VPLPPRARASAPSATDDVAPDGDQPTMAATAPAAVSDPAQLVPPTPEPLDRGLVLAGRYEVAELLGSGGMADVHRAYDTLLGRDVAVKAFRGPGENHAGRQREMRLLARFSHPGLVAVYDAGTVDEGKDHGRHFLVLELVPGRSLADVLRDGPLTGQQVARWGQDIAEVLAFVHAAGVVHRDVKPANILLPPGVLDPGPHAVPDSGVVGGPVAPPSARLADFGIARTARDHPASLAEQKGTPGYLSPEQARGARPAPVCDVYALGLVLVESLSGRRAFDGTPVEQARARLRHGPRMPSGLDASWRDLLTAMTALDPGSRPGAAEVGSWLAGLGADGATATQDDPAERSA
jgi:eukaryotic-like serine/threonine-protein kinase